MIIAIGIMKGMIGKYMIIKKRQLIPEYNERKSQTKFAYFPIKLRNDADDKYGEIIWLEKYIVECQWNDACWIILRTKRYSDIILEKLSE